MESAGIANEPAGVGDARPAGLGPATAVDAAQRDSHRSVLGAARDYLSLTKPRIIVLLLWTTLTTMFIADPGGPPAAVVLWTLLGGYLAAGGAGAINHYLDRDRDARMDRTRSRPLAAGRIKPETGLWFGISLGVLAVVVLGLAVNLLAAVLSLAGLLGYVFVYTAWLKPRTPQNIVIGGAAGAFPPMIGWAAATGGLSADALYPFALVFLWTPPHFWALSLMIKDDYARTGVPMLPVVSGDAATRRQIFLYAIVLALVSLAPVATGLLGTGYLVAAVALDAAFIALSARLIVRPSHQRALQLYLFSLTYLALLFGAMAADRVLGA